MSPQELLMNKFVDETSGDKEFRLLIKVVEKPSGALEVITNAENVDTEIVYVLATYDEEFRHRHNPSVRIVNYILV